MQKEMIEKLLQYSSSFTIGIPIEKAVGCRIVDTFFGDGMADELGQVLFFLY